MDALKFGFGYFKKSMPLALFAEALSFLGILGELLLPLLAGMLIDFIINSTEVTENSGGIFHFLLTGKYGEVHSFELFYNIAFFYIIFILARIVLIYIRDILQEKVGLDLETDLRYVSYHKLMELDSQTLSDYNSGELLQILGSDTIQFKELFCHRIPYFGDSIFILATSVFLLARINLFFIIIPIILLPFLATCVIRFKKKAKENFKEIRKASSEMNLRTQENIAAVRLVRSFENEDLERAKFAKVNDDFLGARLKQIWLSSKFDVTLNSLKQIAYIGTIVIGAILCMNGKMSVGLILTSASYVMKIMGQITNLNNHIFNMQQQIVAGSELSKFMKCESNVPDEGNDCYRSETPDIEFKNVSLTIGDQEILKDINLSIPYGKKLGIVGGTGSGKSVLLKSLVRMRDITGGTITLDGRDIKDYSLASLRGMFSYAFQDVFLFSNTIDSNIAFSKPDIDEEEVVNSSMRAQAHNFINALSDKYRTIVGERGLGISGGQKQRVSVARAFLKNAPVFVLDDSTSALDVNTERKLLDSIKENYNEKTVIITAHRLSSVVECDEILYMQDGEIIERGTFEELMALNGNFANVYNVQIKQQQEVADFDGLATAKEV